jgi:hypothetical protein
MAACLAGVYSFFATAAGGLAGLLMPWMAAEDQETACGSGQPGACDEMGGEALPYLAVLALGVWGLYVACALAVGQRWAHGAAIVTFSLWTVAILGGAAYTVRDDPGPSVYWLVPLALAAPVPILARRPDPVDRVDPTPDA